MVFFSVISIYNPFHSDGLLIYILANSADTDEMQHFAAFNLSLSLFAKVSNHKYHCQKVNNKGIDQPALMQTGLLL